jgi:hypothetical protein
MSIPQIQNFIIYYTLGSIRISNLKRITALLGIDFKYQAGVFVQARVFAYLEVEFRLAIVTNVLAYVKMLDIVFCSCRLRHTLINSLRLTIDNQLQSEIIECDTRQ